MNARKTALKVLRRVQQDDAYSNLALQAEFSRHPEALDADRHLATELVYGVLRRRRLLDHWIEGLSGRKMKAIDPEVTDILRISLYQLFYLDRIPPHAVLFEAGELTKLSRRAKAAGFVNAVLRRAQREGANGVPNLPDDPLQKLAVLHSLPDWLLRRLAEEETPAASDAESVLARLEARAAALSEPAPLTLLPNLARMTAESLAALLAERGAEVRRGAYAPHAVLALRQGYAAAGERIARGEAQVMDEAAQLVGELLDPQPGERILDLCAAPGGKSLFAAARVGEGGEVRSVDNSESRLGLLRKQADLHGFRWLATQVADAVKPLPNAPEGGFDRVLLDAPCSALGVLRRHPEIRWRRQEPDLAGLAEQAGIMLDQAASYVRPGGVLVFSVCTTTREEGEAQLARFLAKHQGFHLETPESLPRILWRHKNGMSWLDTTLGEGMDGFFAFRARNKG